MMNSDKDSERFMVLTVLTDLRMQEAMCRSNCH